MVPPDDDADAVSRPDAGTDAEDDILCETLDMGGALPPGALSRTVTTFAGQREPRVWTGSPAIDERMLVADPHRPLDDDHRYSGFELLGTGASGVVYSARDRSFDREVAIKVTRSRDQDDLDRLARFIQEARVTASLEHPNILPVHDIDVTQDGRTFFTMRKAMGSSLADLIAEARRDPANPPAALATIDQRIGIIDQVAHAVAFAHGRGVVHQDIKPHNIVLGSYGEVLLVDWGTALSAEDRANEGSGRLMGTPAYMSPEQARQEAVDERSDIYCLGATLYHLLTLHYPTWSDDNATFWEKKRRGLIDRHESFSQVPDHLLKVALRAMAADPDDRYQAVTDLQEDLRAYRDHRESIRLTDLERRRLEQAQDDLLTIADIIAHLERALELWRGNKEASDLRRHARQRLAEAAIDHKDIELARATVSAAGGELDDLIPRIDALVAELRRDNRRRRIMVVGGIVATFLVLGLGVLLWREWQRTTGSWYQVRHHDFAAGAYDGIQQAGPDFAAGRPVDSSLHGPHGLQLEGGSDTFWLQGLVVTGDVRIAVELTWSKVDGFGIMHHALRQRPQAPWHVPRSYSCQFAAYKNAYSYLAVNESARGPQPLATGPSPFEAGRRYRLVFERDGEVLRLSANGRLLIERPVFARISGLANDSVGFRSWGAVSVHSITVQRRSIPLYASPLAAGNSLADHGHWQQAVARYRQVAREQPGGEVAAQALARAINASIAADEERADDEPQRLYAQLQDIGIDRYMAFGLEILASWHWRQERFDLALDRTDQCFDLDPGTRLVTRLLSLRKANLPSSVRQRLIAQLARTTDLSFVAVEGMGLESLEFLRGRQVRILRAGGNAVVDLEPLRGSGLQSLDISGNQVVDLGPLAGEPLANLHMQETLVQDVSPLAAMPLSFLSLRATPVRDLTPLRGLPLRRLSIADTPVQDLTPLADMPLEHLSLARTPVDNLTPLQTTPLTTLDLSGSAVQDLTPLRRLPLISLDLDKTQVVDLGSLRGLALQALQIEDCPIVDVSPLIGMPLRKLQIRNAPHLDPSPISTLTTLRELVLKKCGLTSLVPLDSLAGSGLRELDLQGNPLRDLGAFAHQPPPAFSFPIEQLNTDLAILVERWQQLPGREALSREYAVIQALRSGDAAFLREQAVQFAGHSYVFVPWRHTFAEAQALAASVGGYLLEPDDLSENRFAHRLAGGNIAWVGVIQQIDGWYTTRGIPHDFHPVRAGFEESSSRYWALFGRIADGGWLPASSSDDPQGVQAERMMIIEWDE